jgi:ubiquinone/menaquinone biosynthesis C-methylase UbiE
MPDKPDVDSAYALTSADDNKRLYGDWAETYDTTFARAKDFRMPAHVATLYRDHNGTGPVLDAGAGTGLVAQELLKSGPCLIDAVDLSPDMLRVAARKTLYRTLVEADLTERLPFEDAQYNAVVSSGTFTHGHVGPAALNELLRVARPGALFILTIKKDHFEEKGFRAAFEAFGDQIRNFETVVFPIYGEAGTDAQRDTDQGLVAIFRKA